MLIFQLAFLPGVKLKQAPTSGLLVLRAIVHSTVLCYMHHGKLKADAQAYAHFYSNKGSNKSYS